MKRYLILGLAPFALLAMPNTLSAQPVLSVEQPVAIVFEPFQDLPLGEVMTIRVSQSDNVRFDGQIEIVPSNGGKFEWNCPRPILARQGNSVFTFQTGRYIAPISVNGENEASVRLRWRPELPTYAEPGRCDLLVDVRLLDQSRQLVAEKTEIAIAMQVQSDTALSIAGTSGTVGADRTFAFIDFGELETGETAFIIFNAKANSEVDFAITSENNGALVSLDEDQNRIDYSAVFDGSPLALQGEQMIRRRPAASLSGSSYRLDIQIGEVEGAFSGIYQDNLVVEMRAQ